MLTKQEKELLEECMDELYEEYEDYLKTLRPGEDITLTYQLFLSIIKKLGLRPAKQAGARQHSTKHTPAASKAKQPWSGKAPHPQGGKAPSRSVFSAKPNIKRQPTK